MIQSSADVLYKKKMKGKERKTLIRIDWKWNTLLFDFVKKSNSCTHFLPSLSPNFTEEKFFVVGCFFSSSRSFDSWNIHHLAWILYNGIKLESLQHCWLLLDFRRFVWLLRAVVLDVFCMFRCVFDIRFRTFWSLFEWVSNEKPGPKYIWIGSSNWIVANMKCRTFSYIVKPTHKTFILERPNFERLWAWWSKKSFQ